TPWRGRKTRRAGRPAGAPGAGWRLRPLTGRMPPPQRKRTAAMSKIADTLKALDLAELNAGTWSGSHGWSSVEEGPVIESVNPTTGKSLARVRGATQLN